MTSTIRNTISERLSSAGLSGYTRQAEPIIVALEEREAQIKTDLLEFATGKGLTSTEVEALFVEVGLSPEPEPEPVALAEGEGDGGMSAVLAAIESLRSDIAQIKRAAARHGVSV